MGCSREGLFDEKKKEVNGGGKKGRMGEGVSRVKSAEKKGPIAVKRSQYGGAVGKKKRKKKKCLGACEGGFPEKRLEGKEALEKKGKDKRKRARKDFVKKEGGGGRHGFSACGDTHTIVGRVWREEGK